MPTHGRSLSETISHNIQASAHAIAEASHEAVTRSTNAVQNILHYDQVPEWMKVDPYIKLGYRRELNSFRDCFQSLFYPHNEFVNIWSHLLPASIYLAFSLGLYFRTFHIGIKVSTADSAIFQVYLLCTAGCLLLSAIYHCTNSHSEQIARYFLKLDYLGIVLSIIGTNVSAAYFGLYGILHLQVFYTFFYIACAALVFRFLLRDNIDGPGAVFKRCSPLDIVLTQESVSTDSEFYYRAKIIIAFASTGVLPFLHMAFNRGIQEGLRRFAVTHSTVMVLFYLLAFSFYATHIPERWWPHKFDLWVSGMPYTPLLS